jgi:hypothetical protein
VIVPEEGGLVDAGTIPVPMWFGQQEHHVYYDGNGNGVRDPGEAGIPDQNVNLRFLDGTIYQAFPTDTSGFVPFQEIFPFFHWLTAEVDFARFKATGLTVTNDPEGCADHSAGNPAVIHGTPVPIGQCAEGLRTWNQVRPGVFDGGYAFGPHVTGDATEPELPAEWTVPVRHAGGSIVDRLGSSAAYTHLGLGPDQRFASTGGYIVEIAPKPKWRLSAAGEWIIP